MLRRRASALLACLVVCCAPLGALAGAHDHMTAPPGPAGDAMGGMEMDAPQTGDADVDFVTAMIPHHEGAIVMAKTALAKARDPFVRGLAANVIASQSAEIDAMKAWLAARKADASGH